MNGTQVFKTKLLPGGGFHVAGPLQVPGHRGCPRVVVMEWPLPLLGQGLHKGVAHICENDDSVPPHVMSYYKLWCQFHVRHHFYLDIADPCDDFGYVYRPPLDLSRLQTFGHGGGGEAGGQADLGGDVGGVDPGGGGGAAVGHADAGGVSSHAAGGPQAVHGGDAAGGVNPDGGGGGGCIGMHYCDAMFFWDDGANEDVPGGD